MSARDRPLAAYYSHHKCATTYVTGVLDRDCRECGWSFRSYHDRRAFGGDPPGRLGSGPSDAVAYVNAEWEQVEALGDVPAFHVIRDPKDIWVSAYFSHLGPHPTDGWPELAAATGGRLPRHPRSRVPQQRLLGVVYDERFAAPRA